MIVLARVSTWVAPIALMALIFYLSAQPDLSSGLGLIDVIGRKLIHLLEYALLCALWWYALRTVTTQRVALIGALSIAIAYAVSDEFHQSFVPGRTGTPVDVVIDALGASLAVLLIRRHSRAAPPGPRDDVAREPSASGAR